MSVVAGIIQSECSGWLSVVTGITQSECSNGITQSECCDWHYSV